MSVVEPRDFSDTLEIQSVLEAFAARLAAQRGISPAQRALLQHYVSSMEDIAGAFEAWSADFLARYADLSRRFHLLVFELAQCSLLQRHVEDDLVGQLAFLDFRRLTESQLSTLRKFLLFQQDQHRSLIEAITQRNSTRAEALAREQARFSRYFFELWQGEGKYWLGLSDGEPAPLSTP